MSNLDRHFRSQRAIELLSKGFRSPIVVIETNLSSSTVREMAKEISGGKRASSGPLPSPNYFISSIAALTEASIFVTCYRAIGGKDVLETIDVDVLTKAHEMYMEVRMQHPDHAKEHLDINKCWVIARDLRSNMAWLRKCDEDACYYLLVEGQRVASTCPWCIARRTNKIAGRARAVAQPCH